MKNNKKKNYKLLRHHDPDFQLGLVAAIQNWKIRTGTTQQSMLCKIEKVMGVAE
jgi:hypothetical protein